LIYCVLLCIVVILLMNYFIMFQFRKDIYRYSRPISQETEYSVQQKANQSRRIIGQTWSVEQSYKELFLSSLRIC